jgi:CheY-like chemotaxis protein
MPGTFFGNAPMGMEASAGAAAKRHTVLIADDDEVVRTLFRTKLENSGFSVVQAADGLEAWKQLQTTASKIDALVLDMKLPGMHGLEILSRLAASGKALPVVVCTAYGSLKDEFVVATYPKLRFLTKPGTPDQVARAVIEVLAPPAQAPGPA